MTLNLITEAQELANKYGLQFKQLSPYHFRITNLQTNKRVDFWTSGTYKASTGKVVKFATTAQILDAIQELAIAGNAGKSNHVEDSRERHPTKHNLIKVTKSSKFYIKKGMADNNRE